MKLSAITIYVLACLGCVSSTRTGSDLWGGAQTINQSITYTGAQLGEVLQTQHIPPNEVVSPNTYRVYNQWGGSWAPWNKAGVWRMGYRPSQPLIKVAISSSDSGRTFTGQITYKGEGPIDFKAEQKYDNQYTCWVKWGYSAWNPEGVWVIGDRQNQRVIKVNISSPDGGNSMNGEMQYQNEGPIGWKAVRGSV